MSMMGGLGYAVLFIPYISSGSTPSDVCGYADDDVNLAARQLEYNASLPGENGTVWNCTHVASRVPKFCGDR